MDKLYNHWLLEAAQIWISENLERGQYWCKNFKFVWSRKKSKIMV